jgi:AcrR family transcriptional regulator
VPKIVDWDAKRDEILSATWRVIARDGIARTTIRAIAHEANCSHGILSHYFNDKADILGAALVMSHRRVGARMDRLADELAGLDALRAVMLEALPLDDQRDLEAQIEISFWGRVLSSPDMRDLQHLEFERLWAGLRRLLEDAHRKGQVASTLDLDLATHQLVALIDGLSAERVLYPSRVPPDRQVEMLDAVLEGFKT